MRISLIQIHLLLWQRFFRLDNNGSTPSATNYADWSLDSARGEMIFSDASTRSDINIEYQFKNAARNNYDYRANVLASGLPTGYTSGVI